MKTLLIAAGCLGWCALAGYANPIHFYFSTTDSVSAVPPEYTAGLNPTAAAGDTLYLWVFAQAGDRWNGISLGEDDAGTGAIYDPTWYGGALRRWETGSDFTWEGGTPRMIFGAGVSTLGLGPYEAGLGAPVYTVAGVGGTHYLFADVTLPAGWDGAYFLCVGTGSIAREGGDPFVDTVAFGFDEFGAPDHPIPVTHIFAPESRPDIVPEPASLLLIALVGFFLGRREI